MKPAILKLHFSISVCWLGSQSHRATAKTHSQLNVNIGLTRTGLQSDNSEFPFTMVFAMGLPRDIVLNENINVKKEFIYKCYRLNHTPKTAKIRTVNLVAEHVGIVTMCTTIGFTVLIFAICNV